MRLVISDQHGSILIAVPLPDVHVLAEMSQLDDASACVLFGAEDTSTEESWEVSVEQLLAAGKSLACKLKQLDEPCVKKISVHMDDGTVRGPAKGMTGFTLNGYPVIVRQTASGHFVVRILRDGKFEEIDLTGVARYRLDHGLVLVEYSTPQALFNAAISRIESIMRNVRSESVFLSIEY